MGPQHQRRKRKQTRSTAGERGGALARPPGLKSVNGLALTHFRCFYRSGPGNSQGTQSEQGQGEAGLKEQSGRQRLCSTQREELSARSGNWTDETQAQIPAVRELVDLGQVSLDLQVSIASSAT